MKVAAVVVLELVVKSLLETQRDQVLVPVLEELELVEGMKQLQAVQYFPIVELGLKRL